MNFPTIISANQTEKLTTNQSIPEITATNSDKLPSTDQDLDFVTIGSNRYLKMPTTKDCSLESQKQSIQKFVNRRAKFLKLAIDSVLNQATDNGKELTRCVMCKLVEECGLSKKFTIQEVVALRDFMQCGTNVIDRLKCGVETLDPMLEFLPSCIKQQLAEFDASNNLELVVTMHDLITSKESMKREKIGVMIVKHP